MLKIHTNQHGYKQVIYLISEDDLPEFGIPVSVDLSDWLTPMAANRLFDRGWIYPKDFFAKAGLHSAMIGVLRDTHPDLDNHALKQRANLIITAIQSMLQ